MKMCEKGERKKKERERKGTETDGSFTVTAISKDKVELERPFIGVN